MGSNLKKEVFIPPMLARSASKEGVSLGDSRFFGEPKLDGFRAQLHLDNHKTSRILLRNNTDVTERPGAKWLGKEKWPVRSAILDVELVVGNGINLDGPLTASALAGKEPLRCAVVDLLMLNGQFYLRKVPWCHRRAALEAAFFSDFSNLILPVSTDDHQGLWDFWVGHGGEGIMLKRKDGLYVPGSRSASWLKIKVEETYDVVISGLASTRSNGTPLKHAEAELIFGYWNSETKAVDRVGQGLKLGSRTELEGYVGRVAEVLCNGQFKNGALRHPRLKRWREDKAPEECVR